MLLAGGTRNVQRCLAAKGSGSDNSEASVGVVVGYTAVPSMDVWACVYFCGGMSDALGS